MMKAGWLFMLIVTGWLDLAAQDVTQLKARLSIMHRRDGGTAQSFDNVSLGQTVEYPARNKHEMFRVYGIYLSGERPLVTKVIVESYKNNKLLSTETPRFTDHSGRISFVDGYISTKENRVKVRLLFGNVNDASPKEWYYVVKLK